MSVPFKIAFEHLPRTLESTAKMKKANEKCKIYKGDFVIKGVDVTISEKGIFHFIWLAYKFGVNITGVASTESNGSALHELLNSGSQIEILIHGLSIGKGHIKQLNLNNSAFEIRLSGRVLVGEPSRFVKKVLFSIPNLIPFHGMFNVTEFSKNKVSIQGNRIILKTEIYTITLDKRFNSTIIQDSLEQNGGFGLMYSGQIEKDNSLISYQESIEVINCLNRYLSFVNGRKVSALFIKGINKNKEIWADFTNYRNDPFKQVHSWSPAIWSEYHNKLWIEFNKLYFTDENHKTILSNVIYWYIEANGNSGIEARSILAQAALELIYNWIAIETKPKLKTKIDVNSAAGQLRVILEAINFTTDLPPSLINLAHFYLPMILEKK